MGREPCCAIRFGSSPFLNTMSAFPDPLGTQALSRRDTEPSGGTSAPGFPSPPPSPFSSRRGARKEEGDGSTFLSPGAAIKERRGGRKEERGGTMTLGCSSFLGTTGSLGGAIGGSVPREANPREANTTGPPQ